MNSKRYRTDYIPTQKGVGVQRCDTDFQIASQIEYIGSAGGSVGLTNMLANPINNAVPGYEAHGRAIRMLRLKGRYEFQYLGSNNNATQGAIVNRVSVVMDRTPNKSRWYVYPEEVFDHDGTFNIEQFVYWGIRRDKRFELLYDRAHCNDGLLLGGVVPTETYTLDTNGPPASSIDPVTLNKVGVAKNTRNQTECFEFDIDLKGEIASYKSMDGTALDCVKNRLFLFSTTDDSYNQPAFAGDIQGAYYITGAVQLYFENCDEPPQ